ncbi:MAG: OmpA family protein [Verrucomicrobiales bacterium]|nr:OmpA family protein [Verrucomicrobiales bacterium]
MLNRPWYASIVAVALTFGAGCATKGYVRDTVSPVSTRVDEVDGKTTANATKIGELETRVDKDVSRLDERTVANEQKANEANEKAEKAGQRAAEAQGLAEKGMARVGTVEQSVQTIDRRIENLDNYKLVSDEAILFKFNSAELTDEAMAQLDTAASKIGSMNHYVLEVRGYTDTSGDASTNLALSRRRAEAVVRYLTVVKEIPLHRIHVLGAGSEAPAADNKTRAGREQNRRVELKLYVAGADGASAGNQVSTAQTL